MRNRIGIVGGGQLGRMMTQEANKLGFHVTVLDPTPGSPAGQIAEAQIVADYNDTGAIRKLGEASDFLTFEIELADAGILAELSDKGVTVNPSAKTLGVIKDKLAQKRFLRQAGIPVADFAVVGSYGDITKAATDFGYPLVLKARFDGYDGRGNAVIKSPAGIKESLSKLAGRELYAEKWVSFSKELSVVVARSTEGQTATYPVVETIHQNNICHLVLAPADVSDQVARKARDLAKQVMQHLDGAGVFGLEMFLTEDDQVLINEIAPRVHNSGHHTLEACRTSQFEQHIRAITGLPLGSTEMVVPAAVMINILGEREGPARVKGLEKALEIPGVSVHIYGKMETKVERKMGHITAVADTLEEALKKARQARKYIEI